MAVPVITEYSLVDSAKAILNDVDLKWWDDDTGDRYWDYLMDHMLVDSQTFTLQQRGTGFYSYQLGKCDVAVIPTASPIFTGEDDVTYLLYDRGLKIRTTAGTATASSIDVDGIQVDWIEATAALFEMLKGHKAEIIAQSIGSASITPGDVITSLNQAIASLRGPHGI